MRPLNTLTLNTRKDLNVNERQTLIAKAQELGVDFPKTAKNTAIAALIAEAESEIVRPEADESAPIIEEAVVEEAPTVKKVTTKKSGPTQSQEAIPGSRGFIAAAKKRAMATSIVTINNKDPRENNVATSVFLSMENQHFSIAKQVPLDTPVELEQCLINTAKGVTMTLHKDEIVNGQRTGNRTPVTVKKYTISYEQ